MSEVALRDISNQLENAQISKTDDKELTISKSEGKDLIISEPEKILKHPLEVLHFVISNKFLKP